MGRAFNAEQRVVLLIDEIDKADLEFPNDLLHELDRMRFTITETGRTVSASHRPVVIITSNAEKELPDAFLRRCVFHFIDFPDAALMGRIIEVHHPGLDEALLAQALDAFYAVRGMDRVRKKPSTSELIDWIAMLRLAQPDAVELDESTPFLGTLLKKEQDLQAFYDQVTGRYRRRF
jgi:MoxR-like ATPase